MKTILPLALILLVNISCDEKHVSSKDVQNANTKIDTSSLVINDRLGQPTIAIIQKKTNKKRVVLTNQELEFISNLTRLEVNKINPRLEQRINLENYIRQYEVSLNERGHTVVYVNGFANNLQKHPKWQTELVIADADGSQYFHQTINLNTRKHQDFSVNSLQ